MTQGDNLWVTVFFMNEATKQFIREHRMDDVRQLALKGGARLADVDMPMALQQIAGWQTARRKLPSWAETEDIVYPPHLNMEQCSSEQTARYKEKLATINSPLTSFVDLTGGFGVDFSLMSRPFGKRVYVERNPDLCELARHNFQCLGLEAEVVCAEAEDYLKEMQPVDVVFLDPARRDQHGGRTYGMEDCTPNVIELLPLLREKARRIILKLSPMLDWRKAVGDLEGVSEVHIVSVDNECKELLLILKNEQRENLRLVCVNNDNVFEIVRPVRTVSPKRSDYEFEPLGQKMPPSDADDNLYLYEPNASVMKAGCFDALLANYPVTQVAPNSHLFLSTDEISGFPGRAFQILSVSSMNKKELKPLLATINQANIAVRNFPLTAQQLRQKLKLKDGGDVYLFATTTAEGSHRLFICRKIG